MVSIHMVSNLKTAADIGLFVLFIILLIAALPGLGFDNVRTGFELLSAALLCGLILIWTQILNKFFPGYKSMHRLIFTGVLLAVLIVLGIVGRAHANKSAHFRRQAIFVQPS
jgi:uncharacterized PurR-regulated membrane protein YhhQ (DUF165 family)